MRGNRHRQHYSLLDDLYVRHISPQDLRDLGKLKSRIASLPKRLVWSIVVILVVVAVAVNLSVWQWTSARLPVMSEQELAAMSRLDRMSAEISIDSARLDRWSVLFALLTATIVVPAGFAFVFVGQRTGLFALSAVSHLRIGPLRRALRRGQTLDGMLVTAVERRRSWWIDRHNDRGLLGAFPSTTTDPLMLWIKGAVITTAVGGGPFLQLVVEDYGWKYPLLGAWFLVVILFFPIEQRWFARRIRARLEQRLCPDCGYDLNGVPPAFEKDERGIIGPKICPECASPWPLVPPPVP